LDGHIEFTLCFININALSHLDKLLITKVQFMIRSVITKVLDSSLKHSIEALDDGVPGEGYVGDAVPREGEELDDTEDEREDGLLPPERRHQHEHQRQEHHHRRDDSRRSEHVLDLLQGTHQETRTGNSTYVPQGIKNTEPSHIERIKH